MISRKQLIKTGWTLELIRMHLADCEEWNPALGLRGGFAYDEDTVNRVLTSDYDLIAEINANKVRGVRAKRADAVDSGWTTRLGVIAKLEGFGAHFLARLLEAKGHAKRNQKGALVPTRSAFNYGWAVQESVPATDYIPYHYVHHWNVVKCRALLHELRDL